MPISPDIASVPDSERIADPAPSVADALRESARSFGELQQYVAYLVSAKLDQLKLAVSTLILYAVLGVMALVAGGTVLVVSVVMLLIGIAHGLSAAMNAREWAGDLIVGLIIVMALALAASVLLAKFKTASRRRTVSKYEDRRKQQRERFGRDVADH